MQQTVKHIGLPYFFMNCLSLTIQYQTLPFQCQIWETEDQVNKDALYISEW